jgi:hypothetical protein
MKPMNSEPNPKSIKTSVNPAGKLAPQLAPPSDPNPEIDPDLARLMAAWPVLPEHIRAAIRALVESGQAKKPSG